MIGFNDLNKRFDNGAKTIEQLMHLAANAATLLKNLRI